MLAAVYAIRVVNVFSWRYRDPGLPLGQRIGARHASTRYSGVGGNVPQSLLNQACLDIQRGRAEVVLIAGGETWRSRMRLRAEGARPDWPRQDDSVPEAEGAGDNVPMSGAAEERIKLERPAHVYPLFEQALRIAAGESSEDHRRRIGTLWSQFSAVAESNPYAWNRQRFTAEQIYAACPDNRMISWPYTKLMNSNNMVNQAAVMILASADAATRDSLGALGFPVRRHRRTRHVRNRRTRGVAPLAGDPHRGAACPRNGRCRHRRRRFDRRLLVLSVGGAGRGRRTGSAAADTQRPLTVTGGLTFAGGPWNNYVTHSIGTMAERLLEKPGSLGLITANGGYLTKHSFGVYGTEPPAGQFRWEDVQSDVDREPIRKTLINGKALAPSRPGPHRSTATVGRRRHSWRCEHPTTPDAGGY